MATISLCMIVKNEEKVLGRCLDSSKDITDEIIIVDTGSTDGTKEIARRYGAKIFDQKWQDDFSLARNFSFSKATMDYCMWLDADDIIREEEAAKLIHWKAEADGSEDVLMLRYVVAFDEKSNPTLVYYRERIVKNRKGFLWKGRVHEAIEAKGRVEYLDCEIEHHSIKTVYSRRNLSIYKLMEKDGETFSARDRFYYGRELFYHREYGEAVDNFLKFLSLPEGFVENQVEACRLAAKCCYEMKKDGTALEFLYRGLTYRRPSSELCCDIGQHFFDRRRWEQAEFWYRNALQVPERMKEGAFTETDCYGYIPCVQLSVCWYWMGDLKKALKYHRLAGKYKPYGAAFLRNQQYFEN